MCADGFAFGGTTSDSRILLWLIYNCIGIRSATVDTFKTLWRALVWSLHWLYHGKWPTHAHGGTLYAAGLAAGGWLPLAGSCDDDFYNRPQLPTADLIRRLWRPDLKVLHYKWLGCDQYFFGGVLLLLVKYVMASSPEENLKTVFAASLPKLKGTGQQCKGIARVMGEVFRKLCDLDDDRHRLILEAIEYVRKTNHIYTRHRYANRIPPDDREELVAKTFKFCQITSKLIKYYHERGMFVFHYTIKSHYSLHIAMAGR